MQWPKEKRRKEIKSIMDVSVICTQRAYFSSDFEGFFLLNSLGKMS
jgi:hypothetical protein